MFGCGHRQWTKVGSSHQASRGEMYLSTYAASLNPTVTQHYSHSTLTQRRRLLMHSSQSFWLFQSVVNGTGAVHHRPIQSVLNASAGLIVKRRKYDQIMATIQDELHWPPVQQRLDYKLCNFIYKCLHQSAPAYISSVCTRVGEIEGRRHLCSAARCDLVVQWTNNRTYGPCSFAVAEALHHSLVIMLCLPIKRRLISLSPSSESLAPSSDSFVNPMNAVTLPCTAAILSAILEFVIGFVLNFYSWSALSLHTIQRKMKSLY